MPSRWMPLLLALAATSASAAPLRMCFEDVAQPPWSHPDGTGLNLELLRRVQALLGEQFELVARPWSRCQEETRNGLMDAMIGPSDAPERRQYSRPPLLPDGRANPQFAMYEDRVDVYLRVGSGASWDGQTLVNPGKVVVTGRGYAIATVLRNAGYQVNDNVKSSEEGLRILANGGADVAVLMARSAGELLRGDARFKGKVVAAEKPYVSLSFYLMVGNKAYAREPARFEAIWKAIGTVRAGKEYKKLEAEALAQ